MFARCHTDGVVLIFLFSLRSSEVSSWQFVEDTLSTWKWVRSQTSLQCMINWVLAGILGVRVVVIGCSYTVARHLFAGNVQTKVFFSLYIFSKDVMTAKSNLLLFLLKFKDYIFEMSKHWDTSNFPPSMPMHTGLIQESHSSSHAAYLTHQNTQSQPFSCMNGPLSFPF